MIIKSLRHFLFACFTLGCASFVHADIIVTPSFGPSNQTAPPDTTDYEGSFYGFTSPADTPPDPISIGTFMFTIPIGDTVIGATISGTFGDVNISTSTLTDLFVGSGSIEVGACDSTSDPCFAGALNGSPVPWSHTFTAAQLGELTSGSLDFTAVQTFPGVVIVGAPQLDIQFTPEPSSIFTVAGGLLAIVAFRRRK